MEGNYERLSQMADLLKVISHPVRLCILKGLLEQSGKNVTFMTDCLELPQSTVSMHLQKLRAAGIIKGERDGLNVYYTLTDDTVKQVLKVILAEEAVS